MYVRLGGGGAFDGNVVGRLGVGVTGSLLSDESLSGGVARYGYLGGRFNGKVDGTEGAH